MAKLPDMEAMAIFAKIVETRGIATAAAELALSTPTVSKALARLEHRFGARLLNRSSRRFGLTDAGVALADRAARLLADAESAEDAMLAHSAMPRGLVRLAVPMSFGIAEVAPILPEFLQQYPGISVDLHLSDALVDLVGDGFDVALRIGVLADSSLLARRLAGVTGMLVAAPDYLDRRGRPEHPLELMEHDCFGYAYMRTRDAWHFKNAALEAVTVRPSGRLRVNNGEAVLPSVVAGLGIAWLPAFFVRQALADGRLEVVLPGWNVPEASLYLVTPPGGPRPVRIEVLVEFLVRRLTRGGVG